MPKMRSVPGYTFPSEVPISDLNTTPLIDVMLVLLIMFIITIPVAAHKVPMDLPQGPPSDREPIVHRLELDAAGRISLDGTRIGDSALPAQLRAIAAEPTSELHLRTDGATPYQRFDHVLADVKRAGATRLGMIDNERFVEAVR